MPERLARRVLREPTLWFFTVAALLLLVLHLIGTDREKISIRAEDVAALERSFQAHWGRTPTASERAALVQDFVDEELLWREGLRLGLERSDPIVRRRIVQKMTFLLEAQANLQPPTEADLRSYFAAHQQRYATPESVSFTHVFCGSNDNRNSHALLTEPQEPPAHVEMLRARLAAGALPEDVSLPFLRGLYWRQRPLAEVERTFGSSFVAALRNAQTGSWGDPVRSLLGWHLVRVDAWHPAVVPPFDAVRHRLEQDWREEARRQAREAGMQRLRKQYHVTLPKLP